MDKDTRNFIFNTTQAIRRLLEEEFARQLEGTFDVHDDGRVAEQPGPQLTPAERLVRQRIVEAIQHRRAAGESAVDSVRGFQSEAVFTFLNRLAALKMMEARGLVLPCVSQGDQSQGFKEFSGLAPGLIELPDKGYRLYLECLFDEIGREVGVLFDRTDSASLLWPRRKALETVLEKLNHPALADVWAEDETIGWIYQYYNDPEERRAMRDQSSAPRNSRDLAVRNQFFTPRYVVEFLTDNTLGRLWHEMTQGRTRLKEQCRYMVRRPDEVFFGHMTEAAQECPAQGVIELAKQLQQGDAASFAEFTTDDGSFQRMIDMAHTVNGFARHPGNEQTWQWVAEVRRNVFLPAAYTGATTQDILDALFLECRADRHGGDGSIYRERWFVNACNEVRRRALRSREANLPQAELLQQPVFIPFRPLKDPRTIRILDPACGSMHFGLYAFDLLQTIYDEALNAELGLRDKLLHDYGWREEAPNTIRPASVQLKPTVPAWSEYHSKNIPTDRAWVVMAADTDGGDGVLKGRPYVVEDTVTFRVPFAHRVKLAAFSYAKALADGWFEAEAGETFLRDSKCFGFEAAVTDEEAEEAYLRDIPRLIIEHNLHGIDIDPRAAQIAGLALWLRAQKAWQKLGLKPAERPVIRRSTIVCAEPMPGEADELKAFCDALHQPVIAQMVKVIFDQMRLAGEAGSLLKIEEEIRNLVHDTKLRWTETFRFEAAQNELFSKAEIVAASRQPKPGPAELAIDFSGITDEEFWEKAEERIYTALREYAEAKGSFQSRLFAEDAARGFAFIDLCRQRYDVALMNPPFGDASLPSRAYIEDTYGDTKGDVYKAFVECFHARLVPAGYLGIISSRTGFFLGQSEDWRTRVVLRLFRPIALADLGSGVLDAMVEVAAYVLRSLSAPEARDLTLSIVPVLGKVVRDSQDRFSLPKWQAARGGLKRHQAVAELEHLEAHGFVQRSSGDTVRFTPLWHEVKKVTALPEPVFPPLVCVRALGEKDKGAALLNAIRGSDAGNLFVSNPTGFTEIPGSPFAYWSSPAVRGVFARFEPFESGERRVRVGLQTSDDFRFVRVWWESAPEDKYHRWWTFARGGVFSPFYCDLKLLVAWQEDGKELKAWTVSIPGNSHWSRSLRNTDSYFLPGLTWPLRARAFSPQVLPQNSIFSVRGYAVLAPIGELRGLLGILSSRAFDYFFKLLLGRFGFPEFIVGILQKLPLPNADEKSSAELAALASNAWRIKRETDTTQATSHAFFVPASLAAPGSTLAERAAAWAARVRTSEETVAAIQAEIDDLAFRLYGLDAADRAALTSTLATEATGEAEAEAGEDEDTEAATADAPALAADLLAYALGCAFGRWDIRFATGGRPAPPVPDPFAPLPVCPPGQLQNAQGMPARPEDVPAAYPVRIPWDGILVDDPNHPLDIIERVREVLRVIWTGSAGSTSAEAIEHEACEILGVKSLRDYFRKPTSLFADHLQRYSKSRRQAPIYWPLSSPHGLYTVWLYYHHLTADTLFTVLRDHVKPKLEYEERRAFQLRQESGPTPSPSQRRDMAEADELVEDLRAFRDELNRVAPLFRPNLNDGVIINHAPLWRLAGLPKWRKDCQAVWESLANGEYDWAHLALHLWPERVIPKCATDRSLAIAHGLDEVFWEEFEDKPGKPKKWRAKKFSDAELQKLIAARTSPAVKAALESLGSASPGEGTARRGRKKAST